MTNHVHIVAQAREGYQLSGIIRDLKKFSSKKIIGEIMEGNESRKAWMMNMFQFSGRVNLNNEEFQFWMQRNYPVELGTDDKKIQNILHYIHQNPVEAGFVARPEEYIYSSASNYAGKSGVLSVKLLDILH